MHDNKLGRNVALGLPAVPDDERVIHAVVVAPPPPLDALKQLELVLARLVVARSRQHEPRRLVSWRWRARLAELLCRAAVEDLEAGDEGAPRGASGWRAGACTCGPRRGRRTRCRTRRPSRASVRRRPRNGRRLELGDAAKVKASE